MRIFTNRLSAAIFSTALLTTFIYAYAETRHRGPMNGFDVTDSLIPTAEIIHGGPERDGIPAIDNPRFLNAERATHLKDEDEVLGIALGLRAKAYPIAILNWHEIVNDRFGDQPVTVSYCPLCGTGIAFSPLIRDRQDRIETTFGVSGLLYNSDMLLYDRRTESLWSQIMGKAVSGPLKGSKLIRIPLSHTRWRDWRKRFPSTQVLSQDTGHNRDYGFSPYQGYEKSRQLYFPVSNHDMRLHPKERVIGIEINGQFKAYPFIELAKSSTTAGLIIKDRFAGIDLLIRFDVNNRTGDVSTMDGKAVTQMLAFWFAWAAFHPNTDVYSATDE